MDLEKVKEQHRQYTLLEELQKKHNKQTPTTTNDRESIVMRSPCAGSRTLTRGLVLGRHAPRHRLAGLGRQELPDGALVRVAVGARAVTRIFGHSRAYIRRISRSDC